MQPQKLALLSLMLAFSWPVFGQRGHEIQIQTGYLRNWGLMFYDYYETLERRHNYEFDPIYDADLLILSWHYPLNAYIDVGLNFTKSYDASFELLQAESALFDPELGEGPQTDQALFAGLTDLESRYMAYGADIRINHLIKSNKYKFYFILSPGLQQMENYNDGGDDVFEAVDPGLEEALSRDFVKKEQVFSLGLGFGVSYPLKSGINLKILELYDRYIPGSNSSNFMSSNHTIEIRTGLAYQFYRKR